MLLEHDRLRRSPHPGRPLVRRVEVRTVNNRHLKLNAKISDPTEPWSPISNGSSARRSAGGRSSSRSGSSGPRGPRITGSTGSRWRAIAPSCSSSSALLAPPLPARPSTWRPCSPCPAWSRSGSRPAEDPHEDWPALAAVVSEALGEAPEGPGRGRPGDGRGAARAWARPSRPSWRGSPSEVRRSSPSYQKRLTERVQSLLQGQGATIEPKDLIREVAIFAERADIAEEIVRLRAHLKQYAEVIARARERRAEARVRRPGDGPRDQHDRLEGQRRRDQPRGGRDQRAPGEDPGADPERGVNPEV